MAGKPTTLRLNFFEGTIGVKNISSNGLSHSSMAFDEEDLTIGSACSAELNVTLINRENTLGAYNFDGTEFTAEIGVLIDGECEWIPLGVFISEKPDKLKTTLISLTAHDRMVKFDGYADTFLSSISYPVTLKEIFTALCNYVGVPCADSDFPNSGKVFNSAPVIAQDVLCREVLQWIAEAACSFARINRDGVCELAWFEETGVTFTKTASRADYFNAPVAEYSVSQIDKLQVSGAENDIGVIVGTGTNGYQIVDNPFLAGYTDDEIRPYATAIYDRLSAFPVYTPIEMDAVGNWALMPGDIITVQTDSGNVSMPIFSMDLTWNGSPRAQYINSGAATRAVISAENRRRLQTGRAMHEIDQTVEGLKETVSRVSFLTPVSSDTDPSADWTDDEKTANVGYQWFDGTNILVWNGNSWLRTITPTYSQADTPTEASEGDYWYNPSTGEIKIYDGSSWNTDDSICIPTTWTQSLQSRVEITAEGIQSAVTKDNVISIINQSAEKVTIQASKISLEGTVTANSYFKINSDGSMTTTNATITGKITATSGSIGGFTIYSNRLEGSSVALYSSQSNGLIELGSTSIKGYGNGIIGLYCPHWITTPQRMNADVIDADSDIYYGGYGSTESSYIPNCRIDTDDGHMYRTSHSSSSIRYKDNITALDDEWMNVYNLEPIKHTYKGQDRIVYGLIAEQVAEQIPTIVEYMKDPHGNEYADGVDYGKQLCVVLVKAVQDLNQRLERIENGTI